MNCALCGEPIGRTYPACVAWPGLQDINYMYSAAGWKVPSGVALVCDDCGPEEALRLWILAKHYINDE